MKWVTAIDYQWHQPCEWLKVPNARTHSSLTHSHTELEAHLSKQDVGRINGTNVILQTPQGRLTAIWQYVSLVCSWSVQEVSHSRFFNIHNYDDIKRNANLMQQCNLLEFP